MESFEAMKYHSARGSLLPDMHVMGSTSQNNDSKDCCGLVPGQEKSTK
jgi:hypothetical protein